MQTEKKFSDVQRH
jgi:hypothetical protein